MKILVFTGTFRVPTIAHEKLIVTMQKLTCANVCHIVPCNDFYRKKDTKAKSQDRYNMLQLIFRDYDGIEISDYELKNKDRMVYTYETMKYIQSLYNHIDNVSIEYVLGDDNLLFMKKWKNADKFLSEFKVNTVCRNYIYEENIKHVNNDLFLSKYKNNINVVDLSEFNIFTEDISATKFISLFQQIKNGNYSNEEREKKYKEELYQYINPIVLQYVIEHNLY